MTIIPVRWPMLALFLSTILLARVPAAVAGEIVGGRPGGAIIGEARDPSDPKSVALAKVSQFCGFTVLKKYLPETLRGHTLCGKAVDEMVGCLSLRLHGKECHPKCGHGKMYTEPACVAKMKACGYKLADVDSPACQGPGAVTAFEHTPTPRGQLYGHVQFGCGGGSGESARFCSSYKRPIEKSWPRPIAKSPRKADRTACFVPEEVALPAGDFAALVPPELPVPPPFDFEKAHPRFPERGGCKNCSDFNTDLRKYADNQASAYDSLVNANDIADKVRESSVKYSRVADRDKEDEMRRMLGAATAIRNDDFDAAAVKHLLRLCASDQARFYGVFWQMPKDDQEYLRAAMLNYRGAREKNPSGCEIPDVMEPVDGK